MDLVFVRRVIRSSVRWQPVVLLYGCTGVQFVSCANEWSAVSTRQYSLQRTLRMVWAGNSRQLRSITEFDGFSAQYTDFDGLKCCCAAVRLAAGGGVRAKGFRLLARRARRRARAALQVPAARALQRMAERCCGSDALNRMTTACSRCSLSNNRRFALRSGACAAPVARLGFAEDQIGSVRLLRVL